MRLIAMLVHSLLLTMLASWSPSGLAADAADIDRRVQELLDRKRGTWRDLNVPEADGRVLHDLIVERGFRHAVEIGTSTGHSSLWIARALAKTGGRLVTIEIDPRRHREAVANFQAAGVDHLIDARLGDAHDLVPRLEEPIDFVFSDADKDWYRNYFEALWPKMVEGGCFTAHNVSGRMRGIREFLSAVRSRPDAVTTIDNRSGAGLSITCKKSDGARSAAE